MSIVTEVKALLNTEKMNKQAATAQKIAQSANLSIITGIRRTAQVGISMAGMFGTFIDQTYALGIEAGLLSIELISTIVVAGGIATMGASALFKAGAQAAAIVSMIVAINNLRQGRIDSARKTQGAVAAFRLLAF